MSRNLAQKGDTQWAQVLRSDGKYVGVSIQEKRSTLSAPSKLTRLRNLMAWPWDPRLYSYGPGRRRRFSTQRYLRVQQIAILLLRLQVGRWAHLDVVTSVIAASCQRWGRSVRALLRHANRPGWGKFPRESWKGEEVEGAEQVDEKKLPLVARVRIEL